MQVAKNARKLRTPEQKCPPLISGLTDQRGSRRMANGSSWWIAPVTRHLGVNEEYDGEEVIQRYEEIQTDYPSGKLYEMSFKIIAERCRVTSMKLPDSSLNQNNSVLWMRSLGIDVDEFSLVTRVQK